MSTPNDTNPDPKLFGNRLRKLREGRGLSQKKLADLTGVSEKSIELWEAGRWPSFEKAARLARVFECRTCDLLGSDSEEPADGDAELTAAQQFVDMLAPALRGIRRALGSGATRRSK